MGVPSDTVQTERADNGGIPRKHRIVLDGKDRDSEGASVMHSPDGHCESMARDNVRRSSKGLSPCR